jgi:hypothetical protein
MSTDIFFSNINVGLYNDIVEWVTTNSSHTFYLIVARQENTDFETFSKAVVDCGKIPVIITNVSSINKPYSLSIRNAMKISPFVRVYEVAKMAMDVVLLAKANLFIKVNGGILWTR